jgi:translation initiation factor 1
MSRDGVKPVYSTLNPGVRQKEGRGEKPASSTGGPLKMRLEKNGRGGKAVTVLFNLPFGEAEAKKHMQAIQASAGVGGTQKDGTVELRGDVRDKAEAYFAKLGIKVVRAGG